MRSGREVILIFEIQAIRGNLLYLAKIGKVVEELIIYTKKS